MKKGWLISGVIVVLAGGLIAFGMSNGKNVATSNSGSVTEQELYQKLKKTPEGKQTFANMMIKKVLEKDYNKDVDQKDLDQQYDKAKKQYGDSFESTLAQSGMTTETYRDNLYLSALEKAAFKDNQHFSNKDLKQAYKTYTPNVKVSVIKTDSEDDAKSVIDDLNNGKDFAQEAKDKSTDTTSKDKGGKLDAFDSTVDATVVSSEIQKAAFGLKKGNYTKTPVKVAANASTGATGDSYYIVKLNDRDAKGSFQSLKGKMKDVLVDQKLAKDSTAMQSFIGQQLDKAKVNISDKDLKDALTSYTQAAQTKK
ncbi:peptidylprolyl isomerase [Weissella kandleri]|uniref:peptidylprolyl isomerase n=1 Tax=Weissella kandleri TaxID=1616 RepID=UPI00387EB431